MRKFTGHYESGVDQGYTLMERGMFGFYAPEDGHMPSIAVTDPEPVTKIVFKIPVK
jgi:biofilm protein TabA